MGWLDGIKRSLGLVESGPVPQGERQPNHERRLKEHFGVDWGPGGWGFEGGRIVDEMVDQLSDPVVCLGVMRRLSEETPFDQVCIVGGSSMVVLVCNTKPDPACFISGLDDVGIAKLIATCVTEGGKVTIYGSTWLLTL